MKVLIDSNSLLSLVRYYLPFDRNSVLFNFIKDKIAGGEIIIIDKVHTQCQYNARGLVIEKLPYLADKDFNKAAKLPYKTDDVLAPSPAKFLRQVDNQFVNRLMKNRLTEVEYENRKNQYMEDADMKLIILCLQMAQHGEEVVIVTEETEASNDNKLFKKIPAICRELSIKTMTLPELLGMYQAINFEFNHAN